MRRLSTFVLGFALVFGFVLSGVLGSPGARAATGPSQWLFFPFVPNNATIRGTGPWSGSISVQNLESEKVTLRFGTTAAAGSGGTATLEAYGSATFSASDLGVPPGGGSVALSATWASADGKAAPPRVTGVAKQAAPAGSGFRATTDGTMQMVDGYAGIPQADVAWGSSSKICTSAATDCNDLDAFLEGLPAGVAGQLKFDGQSFLPIVQANWFGWETVIYISNVDASGSSSSTAQVTFFGSSAASGTTLGPVTINVPRGQTAIVDVASTLASLGHSGPFVGSAVISSSHAMVASATRVKAETNMALTNTATPLPYVEVNRTAEQLDESGADAYQPVAGTYTLFAPLVFHNYMGWNTGINIANASNSVNTVTVTVYGRDGSHLGTYSRNIAAQGMEYIYIPEVSSLAANDFGTAVLSAAHPFHAVVDEVKYETGEAMAFLAIPANARAGVGRTSEVGIPLFQRGTNSGAHGDTSGLNLFNPGAQAAYGSVTFYNASGASVVQIPFNLPSNGTALIYAPEVPAMADGQATAAVVRANSGSGVVSAVSNVVNYDVAADGGAVFNVVSPLGQFRLACTEKGCGYLLRATDGSLRLMAPWGGGAPAPAPGTVEVSASPAKLSVDDEVTVLAKVTDGSNKALANASVTFTVATTGKATPTGATTTTNDQGIATFKYKQEKVGKDTVTASVTTQAGVISGQTTVEWTAGEVARVTLEARHDPESGPAGPWQSDTLVLPYGGQAEFRVMAFDQHDNPVPGAEASIEITDGTTPHDAAGLTLDPTDSSGSSTIVFKGTYAGFDDWQATVGSKDSNVVRVVWEPKVELMALHPLTDVWTTEPVPASAGTTVKVRADITGFACSDLFENPGEGNKVFLTWEPDITRAEFIPGWKCSDDPDALMAEVGWELTHNAAATVTVTLILDLDEDQQLDAREGEVKRQVTII